MKYDEDLLVELLADGDLSHEKIAEQVGICRRTVWRIANGLSRPDLQQKVDDVIEGYRQAALRLAARHMKALLEKQIAVALEGDGETSRKSREFLLKTFMTAMSGEPARTAERSRARLAAKENIQAEIEFDTCLEAKKKRASMTNEEFWADWYGDEERPGYEDEDDDRSEEDPREEALDEDEPPNDADLAPASTNSEQSAAPAVPSPIDPPDTRKEDVFAQSRRILRQASEEAIRSALEEWPNDR